MRERKILSWIKVDAVGVEAIGYDKIKKRLYIKFRAKDSPYAYLNVKEEKYKELMKQEHKTTYVNKQIKPACKFKKLPEECYNLK